MIKFTATAFIHYISPVIEIPSKSGGQPYLKRELVINDSWERNGEVHNNFVLIEFSGDKMDQLDSLHPGQRVNVEVYVNGREHNNRIFNSLRGQSVSHYRPRTQSVQQTAAAPVYPQQGSVSRPQFQQAPPATYPPQQQIPPVYPQQQAPEAVRSQHYGGYPSPPGVDDLPFSPR